MDSFVHLLLYQVPTLFYAVSRRLNSIDSFTIYTHLSSFFPLVTFMRKHVGIQVDQLIELVVIDQVGRNSRRFGLFYVFFSSIFRCRIFVRLSVFENEPVPSLTALFKNAVWLEREAWDMFGLFFRSHPDLRRILTDYGFGGFPFRKTFPLTGYLELRYDDERMHIVYEPVELSQNYRHFSFLSPWEKTQI